MPLFSAQAGTLLAALWSLNPVVRPPVPPVRQEQWVRTPVDRFVLAHLEKEGIAPSGEASRQVLLRRVYLDLIGLPPTPEQQAEFVADRGPDAYERVVEGLLKSPHYGEKWGRHWLDLARYADSDGYRGDRFRPYAWRYRQWVIDAFNRDLPFDQFTLEQIAGDLLPGATVDQKIATGFHRNTLTNREGGTNPEQFRVEQVIDRTNTVGTVWLGLTIGCAQCHDHKYDPISQRDYYRLFAFFNAAEEDQLEAPLPGEIGPHLAARPEYDRRRAELVEKFGVVPLRREWERRMVEAAANPGKWLDWDHALDDLRTDCEDGEKILSTPESKRTRRQEKILTEYFLGNYHRVITKERNAELRFDELRKQLSELDKTLPPLAEAPVLAAFARPTHLLQRGDFQSPGEKVDPSTPAALPPLRAEPPSRLHLAHWLVSTSNPLTARVTVNRIWQEYFGRGIVATSENFGSQGEKPTHPELLDWLADEFMRSGWSWKHIHRAIVLSSTYRQSSHARRDLVERDPANRLLASQSRLRLPAELIRDSALAASGLLSREIGGPSVRPPQPTTASTKNWRESSGVDRYRRGLYIQLYRTSPYPLLANFDAPAGYGAACKRTRSNTPLQALNLLNDPVFAEAAQALAHRAGEETGPDRIKRMIRLALCREPDAEEMRWMLAYVDSQTGPAAWTGLASALLNLDEFITRE